MLRQNQTTGPTLNKQINRIPLKVSPQLPLWTALDMACYAHYIVVYCINQLPLVMLCELVSESITQLVKFHVMVPTHSRCYQKGKQGMQMSYGIHTSKT